MRIIGGRLSGRRFGAPSGRGTRPTSDRAREALASALESRGAFKGARVIDLFAGTGAFSFEALSRGASEAVAVDLDPRAIRQLTQSAKELGLGAEAAEVILPRIRDRGAKARGLDAAVIEQRITDRTEARNSKEFAEADRIRDELAAQGVELLDGPEGTGWTISD